MPRFSRLRSSPQDWAYKIRQTKLRFEKLFRPKSRKVAYQFRVSNDGDASPPTQVSGGLENRRRVRITGKPSVESRKYLLSDCCCRSLLQVSIYDVD
jgi:hypothetical protein